MARKMKTMDGNNAAAWVAYPLTDVAGIYPITPSSVMAEIMDKWSADGKKNLFGQQVKVVEMQSEAGASGMVHGSLAAGALTATFTASQGLLLMIPNLYKMAGELLPAVIHVSARAVATHALSIFGDHSDVMACRQTGFALLASNNAQEVMDLGAVAHLTAIKGRVPFIHFFDGFRTSHEISKIEVWDDKDLADMVDFESVERFRNNALNPEHPVLRGSAQNPDIFFQVRESANQYYDALPAIVEEYMDKVNKKIGTDYGLFNYYGASDADRVIVAMGSVCDTIEETIDYLINKGEKVGLLKVHLYRPFSIEHFLAQMPKTVTKIAVLDRTKEPGSLGEPLYMDICNAYFEKGEKPLIVGGRYGLGSKDTTSAHILSVYENLKAKAPKNGFTIAIEDDVTHLSLPVAESPDTSAEGNIACKFWGLGSDGTVGANKDAIKIIGDNTDLYVQAYFAYDSKKSGGVTISHLRFGKKPIKSTYLINKANFVACNNPSYIGKYKMVEDLKPNGTFLINCSWNEKELSDNLPADMKHYIAKNNITLYTIDAIDIAKELGLGNKTNMIMQSAFFKLAKVIPIDEAMGYLKAAVKKTYGRKGDKIVNMNIAALEKGVESLKEINVPSSWAQAVSGAQESADKNLPEFIKDVLIPCTAQLGDTIPVSTFTGREDGTLPQGTAAYEKRGIAVEVPKWIPENCIQCGQCSFVCPHAVIRPAVMDEKEAKAAPAGMKMTQMKGKGCEGYQFAIVVSPLDCTGCQNCVNVCPAKNKAIVMEPIEGQLKEQDVFAYAKDLAPKTDLPFAQETVKGSQFKQPLLEFSGACAGCGETPYAKLATQLFGDKMFIANATGCSSIWGGSAPSTPYTTNQEGHGPAWANSLFEDNAEYGLGMYTAYNHIRSKVYDLVTEMTQKEGAAFKEAAQKWVDTYNDTKANEKASKELLLEIAKSKSPQAAEIMKHKQFLAKKSMWIFGGDGWAYDIGYGGLDHVIASGENVNILVFDTEVYSNTGGQSSKATPIGAVAQFAAAGKAIKKKDLAQMAMSYGYVYVAQVAMGADYNQCIKAFAEAESYNGPSIIIAYAPCINHGIRGGMTNTQNVIKQAVASGYWQMLRFDPRLIEQGKNPFMLDSKAPSMEYNDFIMNEVRYSSLTLAFPDRAKVLFEEAKKAALGRYEYLKKYSRLYE